MALSDSASSSIPKKRQNSMLMVVRSYIAKYIRNTLLSRKQTFSKIVRHVFFSAFSQA